jgi:hypothetical protein
MWVATPGGAKISRASACGKPRQRSETPRTMVLARRVQRMVSPLVIVASSQLGNSSIRMRRSLDLIAIAYVSHDGFPIARTGVVQRNWPPSLG